MAEDAGDRGGNVAVGQQRSGSLGVGKRTRTKNGYATKQAGQITTEWDARYRCGAVVAE